MAIPSTEGSATLTASTASTGSGNATGGHRRQLSHILSELADGSSTAASVDKQSIDTTQDSTSALQDIPVSQLQQPPPLQTTTTTTTQPQPQTATSPLPSPLTPTSPQATTILSHITTATYTNPSPSFSTATLNDETRTRSSSMATTLRRSSDLTQIVAGYLAKGAAKEMVMLGDAVGSLMLNGGLPAGMSEDAARFVVGLVARLEMRGTEGEFRESGALKKVMGEKHTTTNAYGSSPSTSSTPYQTPLTHPLSPTDPPTLILKGPDPSTSPKQWLETLHPHFPHLDPHLPPRPPSVALSTTTETSTTLNGGASTPDPNEYEEPQHHTATTIPEKPTMVLVDFQVLKKLIDATHQQPLQHQKEPLKTHPTTTLPISRRRSDGGALLSTSPQLTLDATALADFQKLAQFAQELDLLAGIDEEDEESDVLKPARAKRPRSISESKKYGTWGGVGSDVEVGGRQRPFSVAATAADAGTGKGLWWKRKTGWNGPDETFQEPSEEEEAGDEEAQTSEDEGSVGWGIDIDKMEGDATTPSDGSSTVKKSPSSATPLMMTPTSLTRRLSRSIPLLRRSLTHSQHLDHRLSEAEARLRARDAYLQNTIMDTARRVQELEGLTADLEQRNEEMQRELDDCKEERDRLREEVEVLEADCLDLQNQISGGEEVFGESVLRRRDVGDELVLLRDIETQTDGVADQVGEERVEEFVPFKVMRSRAIQCELVGSSDSSASTSAPNKDAAKAAKKESRLQKKIEARLLSSKVRLSYAHMILAVQSETIQTLESQIRSQTEHIQSMEEKTSMTQVRAETADAISSTKDRVIEDLTKRVAHLESESLSVQMRKRVASVATVSNGGMMLPPPVSGPASPLDHRRTVSGASLGSLNSIATMVQHPDGMMMAPPSPGGRHLPHIDTTLKNMLRNMEDAALGSGIEGGPNSSLFGGASTAPMTAPPGPPPTGELPPPPPSSAGSPSGRPMSHMMMTVPNYRSSIASTISMSTSSNAGTNPRRATTQQIRTSTIPLSPSTSNQGFTFPTSNAATKTRSIAMSVVSNTDTILSGADTVLDEDSPPSASFPTPASATASPSIATFHQAMPLPTRNVPTASGGQTTGIMMDPATQQQFAMLHPNIFTPYAAAVSASTPTTPSPLGMGIPASPDAIATALSMYQSQQLPATPTLIAPHVLENAALPMRRSSKRRTVSSGSGPAPFAGSGIVMGSPTAPQMMMQQPNGMMMMRTSPLGPGTFDGVNTQPQQPQAFHHFPGSPLRPTSMMMAPLSQPMERTLSMPGTMQHQPPPPDRTLSMQSAKTTMQNGSFYHNFQTTQLTSPNGSTAGDLGAVGYDGGSVPPRMPLPPPPPNAPLPPTPQQP
ncbi:hypothetical protein HDU97_003813 [Phlyctochytrium planicorne]|nr:hypothetical protein HDU97_003813 [Phlyctochytrium planicorne]